MKILGIGNAIIDVICKVNYSFIEQSNLTKGTMKLFFDENEFKNLFSGLKIEKTVSGGSVANSMVGISQLGNKVGFIGKISDDEFGKNYEDGLIKEKVEYFYSKKQEKLPTGNCLILVTPDSERTMCTFLGIAGQISEKDISTDVIKKSEIIFLEGYLWDEGEPKKAFDKEQEISSLIDAKNFDEVIKFSKKLNKLIVITRGEKGSISINGNEVVENDIQKNLKIVDLTGAGDLFAAGFLHAYINKLSTKECLIKGTEMSSKIIQKIGARL